MIYKINTHLDSLAQMQLILKGEVGFYLEVYTSSDFLKRFKVKTLRQNEILLPLNDLPKIQIEDRTYSLTYIVESNVETEIAQENDLEEALLSLCDNLSRDFGEEFFEGVNFEDVSLNNLTFVLIKALKNVSENEYKKRIIRQKQNEVSATDDLNAKITQIGNLAGFSEYRNHSSTLNELNALKDAIYILKQEYNLHFSFDIELNEQDSIFKQSYKYFVNNKVRLRVVDLAEDFYKDYASAILGFIELSSDDKINLENLSIRTLTKNAKNNETNSEDSQGVYFENGVWVSFDQKVSKKITLAVVVYLNGKNSYFLLNRKRIPLNAKNAACFKLRAFTFYETFDEKLSSKFDLLKFVFKRSRKMLFLVLMITLFASLFTVVMPLSTAYIVNDLIPIAKTDSLLLVGFVVLLIAIFQLMLAVVPQILALFFSVNQLERFEGAFYDKLLRLRIADLSLYERGDLANRISLINKIQQTIFKAISSELFSSVFAIFSVVMMFYFSPSMAYVGIIGMLVFVVIFLVIAAINFTSLKDKVTVDGKMEALLTQFIDAISKIKAAHAQRQIISRFADEFADGVKLKFTLSRNATIFKILSLCFPSILIVIFYLMSVQEVSLNLLNVGSFMGFMVAFGSFQVGVIGFCSSLWELFKIKPYFDRIYPLLQAQCEDLEEYADIPLFKGDISCIEVSYQYKGSDNLILDNVSLEIKSGEFIAIVGPSGAGKSTLLQLLLGFDNVTKGTILFDKFEINTVNKKSIRKHLGVILQDDKIFTGTILDNIVTSTPYSVEDAKNALKAAAFLDEVERMPMGLYTMVSPDTISGGQMQRILIARALLGNPKVLFMDESTSALDNISQDLISSHIAKLKMTRVVIAHRLSTIMNADRVYVLDKGKIVQIGTPKALLSEKGLFYDLYRRDI